MARVKRVMTEVIGVTKVAGPAVGLRFAAGVVQKANSVLRSGNLGAVDRLCNARARAYTPLPGTTVYLPAGYFPAAREMYCRGVYFTRPHFTINAGDTVVDLGANEGLFSLLAVCAGAERVIAVEAQDGFRSLMESHLRRNGVSGRVHLHNVMLGAETGVFADEARRLTATHWMHDPPVRSLDEIIREEHLDRIDFLKVDIEGSEFAVFDDSFRQLSIVDRIAMEVHTAFGDPRKLAEAIQKRGFSVVLTDNEGQEVDAISEASGYLFAARHPLSV